jgi:predicted nucleic acid-binding protein
MAGPAYLLDTNILLRLSLSGGPYDEVVVSAVARLMAEEATLFYTLQNAAEFWNVCTRPRERNGLGLSLGETDRRLHLIEQQFQFLPETESTYAQWRRIVMECGVSGVQVHDARLAAVMNVNNLSLPLTLNPNDFERFTGVKPIHPENIQPRVT